MFVIYSLLLAALIFSVMMLLVYQRKHGAIQERKALTNTPNGAKTNAGGNSQRAEHSTGGSSSYSHYDHSSMGADNDEDVYEATGADTWRKEDFKQYHA